MSSLGDLIRDELKENGDDLLLKVVHAIPYVIEFFKARRGQSMERSLAELRLRFDTSFDAAKVAIDAKYDEADTKTRSLRPIPAGDGEIG